MSAKGASPLKGSGHPETQKILKFQTSKLQEIHLFSINPNKICQIFHLCKIIGGAIANPAL